MPALRSAVGRDVRPQPDFGRAADHRQADDARHRGRRIDNLRYSLFYRNSRSKGAPELQSTPGPVRPDGYVDFRTTGRDIRLKVEVSGARRFCPSRRSAFDRRRRSRGSLMAVLHHTPVPLHSLRLNCRACRDVSPSLTNYLRTFALWCRQTASPTSLTPRRRRRGFCSWPMTRPPGRRRLCSRFR